MYDATVVGSCNLEICVVEDKELAEKLLRDFPGGNRKLYPIVKRDKSGYLVKPTKNYPIELAISKEKVIKVLASGGGTNAAKVLSKLEAKVLFVTSVGDREDENYEIMVNSFKEEPTIGFLDLPGRPVVGLTLNIVGKGIPSTLLIYGGGGEWKKEELIEKANKEIGNLNPAMPVLAIANSLPYLPILNAVLEKKRKVEYFCPSRAHINVLSEADQKYFEKADIIQDNIDNIVDIFRALFKKSQWVKKIDEGVRKIMEKSLINWGSAVIATRSERGGYFLKEERVHSYEAYPLPGLFIDDTGAGDVFAGAFFWSYFLKKRTFEEAIEFAAAYATFPITSVGAIGMLPTQAEVESWIKQHGPKIQ